MNKIITSRFRGFSIVLTLLLGTASLQAALPFLLWLPSARRENIKDPKSPLFFPPTNTAVPAGAGTPTLTPTITPTPSATPTFSFSPTMSPTPTVTLTTVPGATFTCTPQPLLTVLYDDMENPPCGEYTYDDGTTSPALSALAQDSTVFMGGANSYYCTYQIGTSWGAGFGFLPMGCGVTSVDARSINPTYYYMWIKTDQDLTVYFTLSEDTSITGDVEEEWTNNTAVSVSASSSWQIVQAPLSDFVPNDYFHNQQGNPLGNGVLDPAITALDIQFGAAATTSLANIYMDETGFANRAQP